MRILLFSVLVGGSLLYLVSTETQLVSNLWKQGANWIASNNNRDTSPSTEKDIFIESLQQKLVDKEQTIALLQEKLVHAKNWAETKLDEVASPATENSIAQNLGTPPLGDIHISNTTDTAAIGTGADSQNTSTPEVMDQNAIAKPANPDTKGSTTLEFMTDRERARELRRLIENLHFKAAD